MSAWIEEERERATGGPGGSGPRRTESPIVAILRLHGIGLTAALTVETVSQDLRAMTRQHGAEFAAMVDARTGAQVGAVLGGSPQRVEVGSHIRAMLPRRRYIQIHSHPASSSLSAQDAITLVSIPRLRSSVVIGLDGTWYVLSKGPGAPPRAAAVGASYRAAVAALTPHYRALLKAGAMSAQQAWREHSHRAWQDTAPRVALRYDRVETV